MNANQGLRSQREVHLQRASIESVKIHPINASKCELMGCNGKRININKLIESQLLGHEVFMDIHFNKLIDHCCSLHCPRYINCKSIL